jgi:hypothetical protein
LTRCPLALASCTAPNSSLLKWAPPMPSIQAFSFSSYVTGFVATVQLRRKKPAHACHHPLSCALIAKIDVAVIRISAEPVHVVSVPGRDHQVLKRTSHRARTIDKLSRAEMFLQTIASIGSPFSDAAVDWRAETPVRSRGCSILIAVRENGTRRKGTDRKCSKAVDT